MSNQSPAHQLVGAVLNGRWRLLRLLGEGGMGAVYEADSLRGEGKRAVKLLHEEFVKEDEVLQRFYAEAQASRALQHPNISQVLDSGTAENGTPYLVMELLQGVPLSAYTDQHKAIPPEHAVPIVYGVLQALTLAHAQRIVHRDLKPDNLFLLPDGRGAFHVKVLDFGIAKVMDAAGGMGQKTRTGVLLGTPGYMSPEQIKNAKGVDARSDLWSVGIILYEMLAGTEAFPADNEFARLTVVLTQDARPIEQVAPHLAAWTPFFQRALAKDLAHRFQSAEEMARALANVARGMPMHAGQPATTQPQSQYTGPAAYEATPEPRNALAATQPGPFVVAAPAGGAAGAPTRASGLKPVGTPTVSGHTPSIEVIERPHGGAPWWVVGVVGFVCLGLGFAIGFLVGGH